MSADTRRCASARTSGPPGSRRASVRDRGRSSRRRRSSWSPRVLIWFLRPNRDSGRHPRSTPRPHRRPRSPATTTPAPTDTTPRRPTPRRADDRARHDVDALSALEGADTLRASFEAGRGFPLDPFQTRALDALDAGQSVLVAAPTGSGKTVVAEYAIAQGARRRRQGLLHDAAEGALEPEVRRPRARARHATNVGLLTGDNSINGDAPVVVMTTEVLRNMIYAGVAGARRAALRRARRGALPPGPLPGPGVGGGDRPPAARGRPRVPLGDGVERGGGGRWIETVRGSDRRDHRGAPTGRRSSTATWWASAAPTTLHLLPTFVADGRTASCARTPRRRASTPAAPRDPRLARPIRAAALRTPSRVETVELLADEAMLPAIAFVFSREGCDQAVEQCLAAGLRLTEPDERERDPRHRRGASTAGLADDDLDVLRYDEWLAGPRGRLRRPPRGHGAADEGSGGGGVRRRAGEGGVRHRDAGPRHQHAGAVGGDREALEVHRRAPRVPDARASTRSSPGAPDGAASTTSATRSCAGARSCRSTRWRGSRRAAPTRSRRRSGPPTTWPRTSCAATRSSRPTTCSTSRSRSSTPTATSSRSNASSTATASSSRASARCCGDDLGDVERVPRRSRPSSRPLRRNRGGPRAHRGGDRGAAPRRRRRRCGARVAASSC